MARGPVLTKNYLGTIYSTARREAACAAGHGAEPSRSEKTFRQLDKRVQAVESNVFHGVSIGVDRGDHAGPEHLNLQRSCSCARVSKLPGGHHACVTNHSPAPRGD